MRSAPIPSLADSPPETVAIFDTRLPGVAERLHRERAAWRGDAELEALDPDHFVLIARAGGALYKRDEHGD